MWQGTRKWGIHNKAQSLQEKNGYKVIDCYYHHFKLKYLRGVRLLSLFHLPFVLLFMAAVWERVSMMTPFNCFPRVAFTNFSSSRLLLLPMVVNGWPHRNIATCPQKLLKFSGTHAFWSQQHCICLQYKCVKKRLPSYCDGLLPASYNKSRYHSRLASSKLYNCYR